MEELKDVRNGSYDMSGNLYFCANNKRYKITAKDAMEIAYTLFDSVGYSYKELDNIYHEITKED